MPIAEPPNDIARLIAVIRGAGAKSGGPGPSASVEKPVDREDKPTARLTPESAEQTIPPLASAQAAFNRTVLGSLETIAQQMRRLEDNLFSLQGMNGLISTRQTLIANDAQPLRSPVALPLESGVAKPVPSQFGEPQLFRTTTSAPVQFPPQAVMSIPQPPTGMIEPSGLSAVALQRLTQSGRPPEVSTSAMPGAGPGVAAEKPSAAAGVTIDYLTSRLDLLELQAKTTARLLADGKNMPLVPAPSPAAASASGPTDPSRSTPAPACSTSVPPVVAEPPAVDRASRLQAVSPGATAPDTLVPSLLTAIEKLSQTAESLQRVTNPGNDEDSKNSLAALVKRVDYLVDLVGAVKGFSSEADHRISQLEMELPSLVNQVFQARQAVNELPNALRQLGDRLDQGTQRSDQALGRLDTGLSRLEGFLNDVAPAARQKASGISDIPRGRGQQDLLAVNLDLLRGAGACLICRNGELLAATAAEGAPATGVETDPAVAESLRRQGLTVIQAEPIQHLLGLVDRPVDAIHIGFMLQRLSYARSLELLRACRKSLRPQGSIVIEILNTENATAMADFQNDQANVHPVPLPLLQAWLKHCELSAESLNFVGAGQTPHLPTVLKTSGAVPSEARQFPFCVVVARV